MDGSVGLRVDVDTYRGTRDGVPRLLDLLAKHQIRASFFFSVGPDNMGRHLWRALKPTFLAKMLRSRAARLYGWDILLRGTLWRGPLIGRELGERIRETADAGHEVGLHAWDHHRWQQRVEFMPRAEMEGELERGMQELIRILGYRVSCSAAAGWKCTEEVLLAKQAQGYRYNSDCRGESIFHPVVDGLVLAPQIPVTLPTYDEVIGRDGITDGNYNEHLLSLIIPGRLNVLAIHAEVEGIARLPQFSRLVVDAPSRGLRMLSLGELLPQQTRIPNGGIRMDSLPGREGWVCMQAV